jgi:hypothetical protein
MNDRQRRKGEEGSQWDSGLGRDSGPHIEGTRLEATIEIDNKLTWWHDE